MKKFNIEQLDTLCAFKYIDTYDITVYVMFGTRTYEMSRDQSSLYWALLFLTRLCSDFVDGP